MPEPPFVLRLARPLPERLLHPALHSIKNQNSTIINHQSTPPPIRDSASENPSPHPPFPSLSPSREIGEWIYDL
jgi:hypothetical protein